MAQNADFVPAIFFFNLSKNAIKICKILVKYL